jgi:excisionase family DNA binding protein
MSTPSRLILVKAQGSLGPLTPAVLYEVAAAKYVKIDIATFRELVRAGVIPARAHPGRTRNIYLKDDLDAYLHNLPVKPADRSRIVSGEVSSRPPFGKEVSSVR